MKAVVFAITLFVIVLATGCMPNVSLDNTGEGPNRVDPKPSFPAFVGNWKVDSLLCNDEPTDSTHIDFISIPNVSSLALVTIEEDSELQLCKDVTGYFFNTPDMTNVRLASIPRHFQQGTLWASALREVCWRRSGGETEKEPYLDETHSIQGPEFKGQLVQTHKDQLVFQSPKSPFCNDQKTVLILKKVN